MKKTRLKSCSPSRKLACTVSAAALMLGASQAATIGLKFTVDYCGFGNYVNYVNAPAFGMATNLWQNLTAMGTGYHSCSGDTSYSLSDTISSSTVNSPPGGLYPLPNGSITVNWFGSAANWSGFAGYDGGSAPQPNPSSGPPRGEAEVYAGFIRDGVNFGPGSSGGDNNQPGYSVDIVGLKSVFTNHPFAIQLVAAADSMQTLTNAFVIDATHSTTQSVTYPNPQVYNNVGDTPWYRAIGGGISTVSSSIDADHVMIIGNRAAHGGSVGGGDSFNNGSTISGVIITDKPVATMSPQSKTVVSHDTVVLRSIAAGVPPLSYSWRKNGTPISGATTTTFGITNILSGGNYDVVVTNLYGSATSSVSVVTIDQISITPGPDPGTNTITWGVADAVLQSATSVTGPYTDIDPPATSPYAAPIGATPTFYRYRHSPALVLANPYDM